MLLLGRDSSGSLRQRLKKRPLLLSVPLPPLHLGAGFNLLSHSTHPLLLWEPFPLVQQGHPLSVNAEKPGPRALRSLSSIALCALRLLLGILAPLCTLLTLPRRH